MTKEQLESYGNKRKEVEDLRERVRILEVKAEGVSAIRTDKAGPTNGTSKNSKEKIIALYISEKDLYAKKLAELNQELEKIEYAISNLESRKRRILRLRYVDGLMIKEIEPKEGYSERQIRRIINEALEELKKY